MTGETNNRKGLPFRFLLITDRELAGEKWVEKVAMAVAAGVRAIQLREKDLSSAGLLQAGLQLQNRLLLYPVHFFINSRVEVAKALKWHLHLPESGTPVPEARERLGPKVWIGASTHSIDQAQQAQAQGVDYILFGPVFETPSKKMFGPPQGLTKLAEVARQISIPIFAVGGITPERASECIQNGAYGVAAISAVLGVSDIAAAVTAFRANMKEGL